jgi:hypothetical protein
MHPSTALRLIFHAHSSDTMEFWGRLNMRIVLAGMSLGLILGMGGGLLADDGAAETKKAAMKSYMYIKEDSDRYVGEGIAALKDFNGDTIKTLSAAKERALGDLASNVRVEVSSNTDEKLESKGGKITEDISSESTSHEDVALENVKYMVFKEFPESGQIAVLASLSKEDYRRQLAGKGVKIYLPEWGIKVAVGTFYLLQNADNRDIPQCLIGDLVWGSWTFGFDMVPPNGPGAAYGFLHLGYDWTPWKTRFQPFVPIRLMGGELYYNGSGETRNEGSGPILGYGAGLGVRFWPTDSFSIILQNTWDGAVNGGNWTNFNGQPITNTKLYGGEASLGVMWSGF